MPITFFDYGEAIEYVKQKKEEGLRCEICGGTSHRGAKREKHIVKIVGRIKPETPKYKEQFSPYRKINPMLANDTIVRQFRKEGKPPLRTKKHIKSLAKKMMKEAGVPTVDVRVGETDGKYTDALVRYYEYQEKGVKKKHPVLMIIHPVHQYSNKEGLERAITHEISHMKRKA